MKRAGRVSSLLDRRRKRPTVRIRRRFEFVRAENPEALPGAGDLQDQSDLVAWSLEIGYAALVDSAAQIHTTRAALSGMDAVVVDDFAVVDVEARAIVGDQRET